MKKYLLLLFVLAVGISSCKKEEEYDSNAQAIKDNATIQTYLKDHNITAIQDPSGLYYQILTPGSGAYPSGSSTVTVNYTGTLLDGTTFDSGTGFVASLSPSAASTVISGWQIGLQHINAGGKIKLFVPSTLAYGNSDNNKIPKNSVLIFTIELTSFQ